MGALNQDAVRMEYGNVFVGDDEASAVDFGAVRNVQFSGELVKNEVQSDNRGTIVSKIRINGSISFDWLESGDSDKLENLLKGLVTKTTVAGSAVNITNEVLLDHPTKTSWGVDQVLWFANQNGDKSKVSNIVIKHNGSSLVDGTDYEIVYDETTGKTGVVRSGSALTLTGDITADYDYTPNASSRVAGGTSKAATPRFVKIVGPSPSDSNKTRTVVLASSIVDADVVLPFLDTEEANDVGVFPVTLKNEKNAEWYAEDEINA